MLGVMASYSITVKELKLLFSMLRGDGGVWVSLEDLRSMIFCLPAFSTDRSVWGCPCIDLDFAVVVKSDGQCIDWLKRWSSMINTIQFFFY